MKSSQGDRPKASDISDADMLWAIWNDNHERQSWSSWWTIASERFPTFPEKVVHAKIRQLIKRRLIQGCPCGCRGDLELEPAGAGLIGVKPWRDPWWKNPNYGEPST